MSVNLNRSPSYTNHNIPLTEGNYYRGVVADSFDDLWQDSGNDTQAMRGYGKGGSDRMSFQSNYPNDLYVNGLVKANMIIEGDDRMPIDAVQARTGYAYVSEIERHKVESGEIPLRVYVRRPLGEEAIHMVNEWHKIFDSFPEDTQQ